MRSPTTGWCSVTPSRTRGLRSWRRCWWPSSTSPRWRDPSGGRSAARATREPSAFVHWKRVDGWMAGVPAVFFFWLGGWRIQRGGVVPSFPSCEMAFVPCMNAPRYGYGLSHDLEAGKLTFSLSQARLGRGSRVTRVGFDCASELRIAGHQPRSRLHSGRGHRRATLLRRRAKCAPSAPSRLRVSETSRFV